MTEHVHLPDLINDATSNTTAINHNSIRTVLLGKLKDFSSQLYGTEAVKTGSRDAPGVSPFAWKDNAIVFSKSRNVHSYR